MQPEMEEELIKKALDVFHKVQHGIESNDFNQQVKQLYEVIEKTPLYKLITIEDLKWAIKDDMFFHWDTTIKNVFDDKFIKRFKSTILSTKTYDFYVPIYCLYGFPNNMKLGGSVILNFQDLPTTIQSYFIMLWGHGFSINTEYHHTKEEYINLKKRSVFIHFVIEANGRYKANKKARNLAEDVFHIVRFLYRTNFNIVDVRYEVRERAKMQGEWKEWQVCPLLVLQLMLNVLKNALRF